MSKPRVVVTDYTFPDLTAEEAAARTGGAEFSPNHPSSASMQPNKTITVLWPGIAAGIPSGAYLPRRGATIQAIDNAVRPPSA